MTRSPVAVPAACSWLARGCGGRTPQPAPPYPPRWPLHMEEPAFGRALANGPYEVTARRRGPAAQLDPDTTPIATASVTGTADSTEPDGLTYDEFRAQWARERARREMALGSIRAHLAEQPSDRSIRAAARRWCAQITAMASDVITARQNQEPHE